MAVDAEQIQISKEAYFQLKSDSLMLSMLEGGGVDNWEWYSDALNPVGEPNFSNRNAKLKSEIFGTPIEDDDDD